MKKILHILPHGVIIANSEQSTKVKIPKFTNREFDKHIFEIRSKLDELNNVKLTFHEENENNEIINHQ